MPQAGRLGLLPSQVLFHAGREAYKATLSEFIIERDGTDEADESGEPAESTAKMREEAD